MKHGVLLQGLSFQTLFYLRYEELASEALLNARQLLSFVCAMSNLLPEHFILWYLRLFPARSQKPSEKKPNNQSLRHQKWMHVKHINQTLLTYCPNTCSLTGWVNCDAGPGILIITLNTNYNHYHVV